MAKRSKALIITALLLVLTALPAAGQEQDSICVPVRQLQAMREEVIELRRRDSIKTEIIRNLRTQISTLETIQQKEGVIAKALKERLTTRSERIERQRERADHWKERAKTQRRRKWIYSAGTGLVVLLAAFAGG